MLYPSEIVSSGHMDEINRMLHRLKKGEPVQHILGYAEFCELELKVSREVLVPRPETEELVFWILELHRNADPVKSRAPLICDIGTGSGCIALALKKGLPDSIIMGTDISPKAIEVARENAARHHLDVHFLVHDILSQQWPVVYASPDIIVSNPPYIPRKERHNLEIRVSEFEPDMALFVPDDDPLLYYKAIAKKACLQLKTNGKLFFEIHESFAEQVSRLIEREGFSSINVKKDINGKDRMLTAVKL